MRKLHGMWCLVFLISATFSLYGQNAAGTYRAKIGPVEVIALQDGEVKLDPALLRGIDPADVRSLLGNGDPVQTSVNAFLVRSGGHTVLVDAGGRGKIMSGELGFLAERLRSAGISPESVEAVLITHLHFDHVSGLITEDGKRAFPKAQVRLAKAEYDFWMNPELEAKADEGSRGMIRQTKAALAPYQAEGALRPFAPGEAPFAGVEAIPLAGHTPGQTGYAFGKGKNAVWFVGDVVHFGGVQFKRPDATVSFDSDPAKAVASRLELLNRAVSSGAVLAAAHMAFPGLGRVVAEGKAFSWIPIAK
jgi:glyoxylase-like metal-dependent hydrolase (beta-lactamase superfamily II)